jgi:hypothetical protein
MLMVCEYHCDCIMRIIYNVGHIPNAINVPSEQWDNQELIDELIRSHALTGTVVFHCRMSQVRGPSCATKYLERQHEILGGTETNTPKVYVYYSYLHVFV